VGLAGFVDAIAGGGGLISLPAYWIAGLPGVQAVATNKLSACMGATISFTRYAKSGFIPWKTAIPSVVCAMLGAPVGAWIASLIDRQVFNWVILVLLPPVAYYVLKDKNLSEAGQPLPFRRTVMVSCAISLVMGVYDGFFGPGTGVFLILLLTSLAHLDLRRANGLCKAINWATNVSSLVSYLLMGKVLVPLALTAGCFSIVGTYLGTKVFEKKGARSVRPLMLIVLAIFFIKLITEIF